MVEIGADDVLRQGHQVLDGIENMPFPTIVVVHGLALGGGAEITLPFDYRIAISNASFGFPEVQLGLHPGLGGTYRLPEVIEPTEAMKLMLTGKTVDAKKAKKLGLVDAVIEERHVRKAVQAAAAGEMERASQGFRAKAFKTKTARSFAARKMREMTAERAPKEHYPAPYSLIDHWEAYGNDRDKMREAELETFAKLAESDTATNLIRVFNLQQDLKRPGKAESGIAHVHVIGAGEMGGDIAAWAAIRGKRVTLADLDTEVLGKAMKRARETCKGANLDSLQTRDAMDRLMPDPNGYGVRQADLVIEAVPEKPDLKAKIYGGLTNMKPDAILASNTSSLRLSGLRKDAPDAKRFAGLHFFNPVPKMQLVEVVAHDGTDAATTERLRAFCGDLDKLPVPVSDYPGFLVNRALTPYLMEAMALIDEGVPKEDIDGAALDFGMPMGPVTLADQVGLDICLHVAESLKDDLDKPMADIPGWLRDMVEKGETGKKAGKGFYDWSDGSPKPELKKNDEMTDRMVLPMLDACVECLRRDVVGSAGEIDAAMIFGTGFAPFRGGPMHYARTRGHEEIVERLRALEERHGARFAPDDGWRDLD